MSLEHKKWLIRLLGYDFEIIYKLRLENKADDGLSRISSLTTMLLALTVPKIIQMQDIYKEVDGNEGIQRKIVQCNEGSMINKGYTVIHGRLLYKKRLVIPRDSQYVALLLQEYHDGLQGGHSGVLKTLKWIHAHLNWDQMRNDIQKYVAECQICQTQKYSTLCPTGLLQPLPIPNQIWEDLSMDFVEGLPTSQGINVIMVVVDRLSKYSHFMGLKHPFTASQVAEKFTREVIRLHGFPVSIVSDRD